MNAKEKLFHQGLKSCARCNQTKDLSLFPVRRRDKLTGRGSYCKGCTKIIKHIDYLKRKETIQAQQLKYRKRNKIKLKEINSLYYKKNRVDHQQKNKQRRNAKCTSKFVYKKLPSLIFPKFFDGVITVRCKKCGQRFAPINQDISSYLKCLEGVRSGESALYCSQECKDACNVYWASTVIHNNEQTLDAQRIRACTGAHLKQKQCEEIGYNYCEKCGDIIDVELHHTLTVKEFKAKAINPAGHLLLCAGCHVTLHATC